jgi:nicotinamidase-related amidase
VARNPTLEQRITIGHTALLVIDMQNDFVGREGANWRWWQRRAAVEPVDLTGMARLSEDVVRNVGALVETARVVGVPVVWSRTVNTPQTNARFWLSENQILCQAGTWGAEIIPQFTPAAGELIVTKTRHSAFFATPLDSVLRRAGIETVVVTGTATHGCVESTVRDAMTLDYWTVVLGDCCGQADQVGHEVALTRMDRLFGIATDSARVIAAWEAVRSTLAVARDGAPAGSRS